MLIVILFSCNRMPEEYDCDPIKDPNCDGYKKPNAIINSPSANEIIDTNTVVISWASSWKGQGSSTFSYRLSNATNSSYWVDSKSVTYNCLSDGDYIFYLLEKFPSGDQQLTASTISFSVNHIYGPAIVLTEQCIEATINNVFDVFVSLEGIESALGAFISVSFDNNMLALSEAEALASIISSNVNNLVFIASPVTLSNTNGLIEINMARFGGSTGSGNQIVRMQFQALTAGNTSIILNNNSSLRDNNNGAINLLKLVNANVEIH